MKWIIGTFLTIAICLTGSVAHAQTCTTTKDMPICVVADANGVTSNSLSFSVTYDVKADPYVDKLTVVISSSEVVGMGGGSFVQELLSVNPKDGRIGISGKKKYSLIASSLTPGKKYTVTAISFLGVTETHKKIVTFTTKSTTTSPGQTGTGVGTTPVGTGTGVTPGGTGVGTTPGGTGLGQGQSAETATSPGGLIDCEGAGCSFQHLINLVQRGIAFVIRLILPIAAIILAYTGFLFMTSGGNEEVRARAKGILTKTLIGIALILCSVLIVNLLYKAFGVKSCYNLLGRAVVDENGKLCFPSNK